MGKDTPNSSTDADVSYDAVHGCTFELATPMVEMDLVKLDWAMPHKSCIIIKEKTMVSWKGNFTMHPLVGGTSPDVDSDSIITTSALSGLEGSIGFANAGTYPYFCAAHPQSMKGTIYVTP